MQLNKFLTLGKLGAAATALMAPAIAFAQDAAPAVAAAAPVPEKADTAFMYIATILVLFMIIPGLALFYGGLVRTKNMLSVLMQCTVVGAVMMLVWVIYGYSFAFGGGTGPYFGGFGKLFLSGVSLDSTSATFSQGVVIYEYTFIAFQMTFAAITPALIIGAFAERVKFSAVILFTILWATFVYFPIAHMVWDANGLIFGMGALDFAGGTVVHINAGIAGLIGAIMVGKRTGFGKDMMAPHSMTLTLVGAAMLWFGWFGFNAGSNLEASGGAVLATMNTFLATAAAIVSWSLVESFTRGKASMLGAASGMIAGLVAVTPGNTESSLSEDERDACIQHPVRFLRHGSRCCGTVRLPANRFHHALPPTFSCEQPCRVRHCTARGRCARLTGCLIAARPACKRSQNIRESGDAGSDFV